MQIHGSGCKCASLTTFKIVAKWKSFGMSQEGQKGEPENVRLFHTFSVDSFAVFFSTLNFMDALENFRHLFANILQGVPKEECTAPL